MEALAGSFGSAIIWVILIPVFIGVIALIMSLRYLVGGREDVLDDRLQRTLRGAGGVSAGELDQPQEKRGSVVATAMQPLAAIMKPKSPDELGRLQQQLSSGGFRGEHHQAIFLGAKAILTLAGGLGVVAFQQFGKPIDNGALFTVFAMIFGYYGPNVWLNGKIQERQRSINRALPDTLDLLTTCVEAGLGLDAALARVSEEVQLSSVVLADELNQVALEMRAGVSRAEAFRRLGSRNGVDELRSLAAIIVQTEIFGTSIAKSLRIQADAMRIRRMQLAEERAAAVPVKLTIPLTLCVLPALMVVLMGPAAVSIIRTLLPTLAGGGGN